MAHHYPPANPPAGIGALLLAVLVTALLVSGCTATVTSPLPPVSSEAPSSEAPSSEAPSGHLPSAVSPVAGSPAPIPVSDPRQVTGTLDGKTCHITGTPPHQLPDPACTPGSFDPKITAAILCAPGYTTRTYRPPATGKHGTTRFKYGQAYPAYGVDPAAPAELDHLISLELGGSNDAANLWPEVGKVPNPKDTVENTLHDWVCSASGSQAQGHLEAAQRAIAADWMTALQVTGARLWRTDILGQRSLVTASPATRLRGNAL